MQILTKQQCCKFHRWRELVVRPILKIDKHYYTVLVSFSCQDCIQCIYENAFVLFISWPGVKQKLFAFQLLNSLFALAIRQKRRHAVLKAAIMIITTYHHNACFNFSVGIIYKGP